MFKNVIVGVDGRVSGRDAIALARRSATPAAKLTPRLRHPYESSEDVAESDELLERERSAADLEAELLSVVASTPAVASTSRPSGTALICWWWAPGRHGAFGAHDAWR